jgi:hypothetical protein
MIFWSIIGTLLFVAFVVFLSIHVGKHASAIKRKAKINKLKAKKDKLSELYHKHYCIIRGHEDDKEYLNTSRKLREEIKSIDEEIWHLEHGYSTYDDYTWIAPLILFFGVVVVGILVLGVGCDNKKQIEEFKYQKEIIEEAVENGTDLENVSITQTIIEQNSWLAQAKADVDAFGIASFYYGLGVEDLEPIKIKRE